MGGRLARLVITWPNQAVALDRAGITVFHDITFLAAGPASERSRSLAKVDAVDHDLTLSLDLREQSEERLVFGLRFLNRSSVKLLLPYPEIHGLRFGNKRTMKESEWYTCLLQSSDWAGFTLAPGQSKTIEYCVRP